MESTLQGVRSWGFSAGDEADVVAATTAGDFTVELRRVPLDSGGHCIDERVIGPQGDIDHGGSSICHGDSLP